MKTRLKLKAMTVAILVMIMGLFAPFVTEAEGGITPRSTPGTTVVYPTLPTAPISLIEFLKRGGSVVYGEMNELYGNDYVAVPTGESMFGAWIMYVTHVPVAGQNGYVVPRLDAHPSSGKTVRVNFTGDPNSFLTSSNGLKEVKGKGRLSTVIPGWPTVSRDIFFYTFEQSTGVWKTKLSWGTGAGPNSPGEALERTQHATRPGYPVNYGIKTEIVMRNGVPTLYVTSDSEGEYILQASNDLTTWTDVGATITPIPALGVWKMGVFYEFNMVEPDPPPTEGNSPTPAPNRFYRYVMR